VTTVLGCATKLDSLLREQISKVVPSFDKPSQEALLLLVEQLRSLSDCLSSLFKLSKGVSIADDATLPTVKAAIGAHSELTAIRGGST
jgi:hypothetical protein